MSAYLVVRVSFVESEYSFNESTSIGTVNVTVEGETLIPITVVVEGGEHEVVL